MDVDSYHEARSFWAWEVEALAMICGTSPQDGTDGDVVACGKVRAQGPHIQSLWASSH